MPMWCILGLSLMLISGASTAVDCAKKYNIGEECSCDEDVRNLPIPTPDGFSLFAVCHMSDVTDGQTISIKAARNLAPARFDGGSYFYRGSITLAGNVVKADDQALGHTVNFYPDRSASSAKSNQNQSRLQKFSHLESVSLVVDEKTIGTANLVANEKTSWCAQATITLKEIEIYVADTEGEGPVAKKYVVVRRSKFAKC